MEFCSIFNVIKRTAFASFNIHKLYLDIWESICRYSKLGAKMLAKAIFALRPVERVILLYPKCLFMLIDFLPYDLLTVLIAAHCSTDVLPLFNLLFQLY